MITAQARWICMVTRSGFHNGATCSPDYSHIGWDCGWYFNVLLKAPGRDAVAAVDVRAAA